MQFTKDIEEQEGLVRRLRNSKEREWKRLETIHEQYSRIVNKLSEEKERLRNMRNRNEI